VRGPDEPHWLDYDLWRHRADQVLQRWPEERRRITLIHALQDARDRAREHAGPDSRTYLQQCYYLRRVMEDLR
jgi:hypothetical protein